MDHPHSSWISPTPWYSDNKGINDISIQNKRGWEMEIAINKGVNKILEAENQMAGVVITEFFRES